MSLCDKSWVGQSFDYLTKVFLCVEHVLPVLPTSRATGGDQLHGAVKTFYPAEKNGFEANGFFDDEGRQVSASNHESYDLANRVLFRIRSDLT